MTQAGNQHPVNLRQLLLSVAIVTGGKLDTQAALSAGFSHGYFSCKKARKASVCQIADTLLSSPGGGTNLLNQVWRQSHREDLFRLGRGKGLSGRLRPSKVTMRLTRRYLEAGDQRRYNFAGSGIFA